MFKQSNNDRNNAILKSAHSNCDLSPYSNDYKLTVTPQNKEYLCKRLIVKKLTRKELEDKYFSICDESFIVKQLNNDNEKRIKCLTTKLLRLSHCVKHTGTGSDKKQQHLNGAFSLPQSGRSTSRRVSSIKLINELSSYRSNVEHDTNHKIEGKTNQSAHSIEIDEKCTTLTNEIVLLKEQINNLNAEILDEKKKNFELTKEISDFENKLRVISVNKQIDNNLEVIDLKRIQQELSKEIQKLSHNKTEIQNESLLMLKRKSDRIFDLEVKQKKDCELIVQLEQKIENLEMNRKNVKKQSDDDDITVTITNQANEKQNSNMNAILEDSLIKESQIEKLNIKITELTKSLESTLANVSVLEHSQNDLIDKLKTLRDEKDQLEIEFEGTKCQAEYLIEKNRMLEGVSTKYERKYNESKTELKGIENEIKSKQSNLTKVITDKWSSPTVCVGVSSDHRDNVVGVKRDSLRQRMNTSPPPAPQPQPLKSIPIVSSNDSPLSHLHYNELLQRNRIREKSSSSSSILTEKNTLLLNKFLTNSNKENEREQQQQQQSFSKEISLLEKCSTRRSNQTNFIDLTVDEGSFEIHVDKVKIIMNSDEIENFSELQLNWNFHTHSKTVSCSTKKEYDDYLFRSATVYKVDINDNFFNYLKNVSMEVTVISVINGNYDKCERIGKCCISFSEILDFPQNKIQRLVKIYKSSVNEKTVIGTLHLWFRLTCDITNITDFEKNRSSMEALLQNYSNQTNWLPLTIEGTSTSSTTENTYHFHPTVTEHVSEDHSMARINLIESASDENKYKKGEIIIEIFTLELNDQHILNDPNVKQIYIEYSFFGYNGELMESPSQSLNKPFQSNQLLLEFNFRKKFDFDECKNLIKFQHFIEQLKTKSNTRIHFLIVNEPFEEDVKNGVTLDCSNIGWGSVNLQKLITESDDNQKTITLSVHSTKSPHDTIGKLTIAFEGLIFMKNCFNNIINKDIRE